MDIRDRIIERSKQLGLRQIDISRRTGATKATVSNWFAGKDSPSKYIVELSKVLECSPEWILKGAHGEKEKTSFEYGEWGQGKSSTINDYKVQEAQVLGHVDAWDSKTDLDDDEVEVPFFMDVELAAGIGGELANENRGYKLRFAKSTLKRSGVDPAAAACVKIFGNSMEPRLFDGDVVGVNTSDKNVVDGKTYAINHEGMLRVKRLYRLPGGGLRVNSLNSAEHPDEHYNADERSAISIIGRVFWHSSIWS